MKLHVADMLIDCPKAVVDFTLDAHLSVRRRYVSEIIEFITGMERCIWAEMDKRPAGVFLWTVHDHGRRWWVEFCAVAARAVGRGVYRAMRARFTRKSVV